MKKTIKIMLTLALVIAALCITASAESTNGFYGIGSADNVTIAPYAGATAVESTEADVDADDNADVYYEGSDRIVVTYSAATAGEDYGVILVEGTGLPTASSAIYYINQDEATASGVAFNVYPKTITAPEEGNTRDFTLYISSSVADAGLVEIPMSYVVGYEEVVEPEEPEILYGDINGDGIFLIEDIRDLTRLKRFYAGYDVVVGPAN